MRSLFCRGRRRRCSRSEFLAYLLACSPSRVLSYYGLFPSLVGSAAGHHDFLPITQLRLAEASVSHTRARVKLPRPRNPCSGREDATHHSSRLRCDRVLGERSSHAPSGGARGALPQRRSRLVVIWSCV